MNELSQSALFWAGLAIFIVFMAFVVDRIFRRMINRRAEEASHYPHRVANELPRTLHKKDHDEVLDLQDDAGSSSK